LRNWEPIRRIWASVCSIAATAHGGFLVFDKIIQSKRLLEQLSKENTE